MKSAHPFFYNRGAKRFQLRNEDFLSKSRKSRGCPEAYASTSHKEPRRLTQSLARKTIYERKLNRREASSLCQEETVRAPWVGAVVEEEWEEEAAAEWEAVADSVPTANAFVPIAAIGSLTNGVNPVTTGSALNAEHS